MKVVRESLLVTSESSELQTDWWSFANSVLELNLSSPGSWCTQLQAH